MVWGAFIWQLSLINWSLIESNKGKCLEPSDSHAVTLGEGPTNGRKQP